MAGPKPWTHWLGRISTRSKAITVIVLAVLVLQYAALNVAVQHHADSMYTIGVRDREATTAINALADSTATLSRLMVGTAGGLYAAPGIAHSLPALSDSILANWRSAHDRLQAFIEPATEAEAAKSVAALPALVAKLRTSFAGIKPNPSPDERVLIEKLHDEWLDLRVPLERFIRQVRTSVEAQARSSVEQGQALIRRLNMLANAVLILGVVAIGLIHYVLVYGIARPVTRLVDTTRRVTAGETNVTIPEVARTGEIGDLARAVDALRTSRVENLRLQAEAEAEARRAEEMQRARDAEATANRSKSEFLANMSHELRTPLNAIIGFSEMTSRRMLGDAPPVYVEYAGHIHRSALHLLSVISDILDMSKIEAGQVKLDEDHVDLAQAVAACVTLVQTRAMEGRVAVSNEIPADVPLVLADERAMKQVLLNLLSNSVKFTEPGGRVTLGAAIDAEGWLVLRVGDTGVGIAEHELARVFEPFRQAETGRKRGGTGLGLSISRNFMELHGGTLTLESQVGLGTTAVAKLPPRRVLSDRRIRHAA
jgi:signal transduction histidine kinase